MSLFFHKFYKVFTVSGGSAVLTPDKFGGDIMHVVVRSKTPSNTFNFTIKDVNLNFAIFQRESIDGELNEFIRMPVKGFYSLHIDSATIDEDIRIYLVMREI